ncbi:MAG: hypothetical protein QM619_08915 [Micropruina sp.]|uniref:hypothetical protein n=1 Tax=Micropruina sp. TaxID=2737536 RepID=UPI0039E720A2
MALYFQRCNYGDGGECAKYWLQVLIEIKNRGVVDAVQKVRQPRIVQRVSERGRRDHGQLPAGHASVS